MNNLEKEIQSIMSRAAPVNDNSAEASSSEKMAGNISAKIINNSITVTGNRNFIFAGHGNSVLAGALFVILTIAFIFF